MRSESSSTEDASSRSSLQKMFELPVADFQNLTAETIHCQFSAVNFSENLFLFFATHILNVAEPTAEDAKQFTQRKQDIERFWQILSVHYLNQTLDLNLSINEYLALNDHFKLALINYLGQCVATAYQLRKGSECYRSEVEKILKKVEKPSQPEEKKSRPQMQLAFAASGIRPTTTELKYSAALESKQSIGSLDEKTSEGLFAHNPNRKQLYFFLPGFANNLYHCHQKLIELEQKIPIPYAPARLNFLNYLAQTHWWRFDRWLMAIPLAMITGFSMLFEWINNRKKLTVYSAMLNKIRTINPQQLQLPKTFNHLDAVGSPAIVEQMTQFCYIKQIENYFLAKEGKFAVNLEISFPLQDKLSDIIRYYRECTHPLAQLYRKFVVFRIISSLKESPPKIDPNKFLNIIYFLYKVGELSPVELAYLVFSKQDFNLQQAVIEFLIKDFQNRTLPALKPQLFCALIILLNSKQLPISLKMLGEFPVLTSFAIKTLSEELHSTQDINQSAAMKGLMNLYAVLIEQKTLPKSDYDDNIGQINQQLTEFFQHMQDQSRNFIVCRAQAFQYLALQLQNKMIPWMQLASFCYYTARVDPKNVFTKDFTRLTPIAFLRSKLISNQFALDLITLVYSLGKDEKTVPSILVSKVLTEIQRRVQECSPHPRFTSQALSPGGPLVREVKDEETNTIELYELQQLYVFINECWIKSKISAVETSVSRDIAEGLPFSPSSSGFSFSSSLSRLSSLFSTSPSSSSDEFRLSVSTESFPETKQIADFMDPVQRHCFEFFFRPDSPRDEIFTGQNQSEFAAHIHWYQENYLLKKESKEINPFDLTRAGIESLIEKMKIDKKPFGLFFRKQYTFYFREPYSCQIPIPGVLLNMAIAIHLAAVAQLPPHPRAAKWNIITEMVSVIAQVFEEHDQEFFVKFMQQNRQVVHLKQVQPPTYFGLVKNREHIQPLGTEFFLDPDNFSFLAHVLIQNAGQTSHLATLST